MSWPYLRAACALCLPTTQKIIAIALGDGAAFDGTVKMSNAAIGKFTGQSHQTVRQGLRALRRSTLVCVAEHGTPLAAPLYRLMYPGAFSTDTPLESRPPLDSRDLKSAAEGLKKLEGNDRSLIPSARSRKAEAARRLEMPTRDQVTKLVHILIDDPVVEITCDGDLRELIKRACADAYFVYDSAIVQDGINRALAQRGQNPQRPLDIDRARRRAR